MRSLYEPVGLIDLSLTRTILERDWTHGTRPSNVNQPDRRRRADRRDVALDRLRSRTGADDDCGRRSRTANARAAPRLRLVCGTVGAVHADDPAAGERAVRVSASTRHDLS